MSIVRQRQFAKTVYWRRISGIIGCNTSSENEFDISLHPIRTEYSANRVQQQTGWPDAA